MRVLVIGGGAIGGVTAAGLDAEVVVLDANAEHVARMRDPGLVIGDADPVALDAVTADPEGFFDFALIAIKAPLHEVVIPGLAARGGIGAFCTLGNGLIQDRIEAIVGEGNLLACLVEWGGTNVGPGRLARDSEGGYVVGELDGSLSQRAQRLVEALQPIGASRVTDNVRGMIWTKLLVNSTFTGLSAITGLRYGPASDVDHDVVFALWAEGVAVGQGLTLQTIHGIEPHDFTEAALAHMMEGSANVKPSMLQDLEAGRATEVDVVNGGVASRGRELGIPTPGNDKVVELVHAIERGELESSPDSGPLRQRRADDQRHRQLNAGGDPRRGMQRRLEAVLGELARDQQVEDEDRRRLSDDADEPEHERVIESIPAGAGEEDREELDQAQREQRHAREQAGARVALHHERAELAGRHQIEHVEADDQDREADPGVRENLQDGIEQRDDLPQSAMTCGTNRERLLVTSPVDSRMPSPAGSMSTVQTPSTGWLPS